MAILNPQIVHYLLIVKYRTYYELNLAGRQNICIFIDLILKIRTHMIAFIWVGC